MILQDFSNFLQLHNEELLTHKTTPLELLHVWLEKIINKNPKNNIEKIIHKEVLFCKNQMGDYLIVGKSDSGRALVKALIEFAKSYDNYNHAKWIDMLEKACYKSKD